MGMPHLLSHLPVTITIEDTRGDETTVTQPHECKQLPGVDRQSAWSLLRVRWRPADDGLRISSALWAEALVPNRVQTAMAARDLRVVFMTLRSKRQLCEPKSACHAPGPLSRLTVNMTSPGDLSRRQRRFQTLPVQADALTSQALWRRHSSSMHLRTHHAPRRWWACRAVHTQPNS